MKEKAKPGLLLVANYDSAVGYAWWLMESYWVVLAERYQQTHTAHLAYPTISALPDAIATAPIATHKIDFAATSTQAVRKQLRFLLQQHIKCIYFSDAASWHWRYLIFRLLGVKRIVTHDHTPGLRTQPKGVKKFLKYAIQRMPFITADGLIGATEFVRSRHIEVLCVPKSKCYVAANGLPPPKEVQATDVRKRFDIPPTQKIMVMAARAHMYKGIDFALRCVADLVVKHHRSDLHFLFCGDGPDLSQMKSLCTTLGISDYVTFAGRCENLDAILRESDIAIQPSQGEVGYSLSILEYMRAGLPTVVPDNPSVCGATKHGESGFIYSNGNVAAAVRAILTLIEQKHLRDTMGEKAKLMCEEFTLAKGHAALLEAVGSIYAPSGSLAAASSKAY